MKILFLISDGFGIGGTIRTTFNLAEALAGRGHDVEVLSTLRRRDVPSMPLDPAVRLTAVVEARKDHPEYVADDPDRGRPPAVYPKHDYRAYDYDLMVERRYASYLGAHDADAVIATRPGLIAYAARFAPRGMVRVGQEHLTREMHGKRLRLQMARHYPRLDALVTVSQRDADDYRRHLLGTRVLFIPNSVPAPAVPPSDGRHPIVVAAGRLVGNKRYDVLIRAFAKVAAQYPDWQLRVYGGGDKSAELRRLVADLGLHNRVLMLGAYSPIEPEWAKGAIAAVPSDKEPFGMTLVEAMRCGVPVVSTDAPYGPREILADGVDGFLTPVGDPAAMADALIELIADPARRAAMAAAALRASERYDPGAVAERYERLLTGLARRPARRLGRFLARRAAPVAALAPAEQAGAAGVDCLVTADGGVELRVAEPGSVAWEGAAGSGEVPVPAGGTVRLPEIGEGSYTLSLVAPDGSRRPLLAGRRDTRALLDAVPDEAGGVTTRLPFRHRDGVLGLRVWQRPVHPEAGDLTVEDSYVRLAGRLFGAELGEGAELELRCRADAGRSYRVPVRRTGGAGWEASIPAGALTPDEEPACEVWDARLRPAAGAGLARVARLLDDVHDKGTAYVYPAVPSGPYTVQPFFTVANEFSMRVTRTAA